MNQGENEYPNINIVIHMGRSVSVFSQKMKNLLCWSGLAMYVRRKLVFQEFSNLANFMKKGQNQT